MEQNVKHVIYDELQKISNKHQYLFREQLKSF